MESISKKGGIATCVAKDCCFTRWLASVNLYEEEPVMEADPRGLVFQYLMKALLDPPAVEEEKAAEVEGSVQEGNDRGGSDDLDDTVFCIPCKGNVCFCEDERQVTFFPSDEEYYEGLDEASRSQVNNLDEDQRYCSSDDEEDPEVITSTQTEEGDAAAGRGNHTHRLYNTKYGSKQLVPMDAILAKNIVSMSVGKG